MARTSISSTTRSVELDATLSDQSSATTTWSSDATERENVSDHAVDGPDTFGLVCVINADSTEEEEVTDTRLEDLRDEILGLIKDHNLVTVVTGVRVYSGYGITSVVTSRSGAAQSRSPRVNISFQKINIVRARATRIPTQSTAAGVTDQATAESDGGTQTATESDGGTTQVATQTSILRSGFDFVSGR